jgi:hypothetical protein
MRTKPDPLVRRRGAKPSPEARVEGLIACPSCGSGRLVCTLPPLIYDACVQCSKVWERLPAGEPLLRDEEMLPFQIPCDNCAFRGKSDERADKEFWAQLQLKLSMGGAFYCHKGVPLKDLKAGLHEFEFPRVTKTIDVAGECRPYETWDASRMRLCRGYLNQWAAGLRS